MSTIQTGSLVPLANQYLPPLPAPHNRFSPIYYRSDSSFPEFLLDGNRLYIIFHVCLFCTAECFWNASTASHTSIVHSLFITKRCSIIPIRKLEIIHLPIGELDCFWFWPLWTKLLWISHTNLWTHFHFSPKCPRILLLDHVKHACSSKKSPAVFQSAHAGSCETRM